MLYRNVADQEVFFMMINALSAAPGAGAIVTAWITKDGGAQAAGGGTVDDLGNGQYRYNFSQADTNGGTIGLLLVAAGYIPVSLDSTTFPAGSSAARTAGAGLVSVDRVRKHLRLPATLNDPDLLLKIEEASAIVLAFIARPRDAAWTAEIAAWTALTAPSIVQAAVLHQTADLYVHRGDERGEDAGGICPEAAALLRATGYRDPVVA